MMGLVPPRVGHAAGPVGSRAFERPYRDRPASWRLVSSWRVRIMADGTVIPTCTKANPFRTSPSDRHVRLGQCMLLSAGWYKAGFIVLSDRLMERPHGRGVSRRSDHGCSHKTPTNVSLCLDRLVDASLCGRSSLQR